MEKLTKLSGTDQRKCKQSEINLLQQEEITNHEIYEVTAKGQPEEAPTICQWNKRMTVTFTNEITDYEYNERNTPGGWILRLIPTSAIPCRRRQRTVLGLSLIHIQMCIRDRSYRLYKNRCAETHNCMSQLLVCLFTFITTAVYIYL